MDSSTHRALFVPGTVIGGRYEVIDTVGKGGMGIVLRVNDRALNNEVVALKLLYPHMAKDQTQFARFQNEVLVARKLSHPNIVRLYDFGSAGQGYYYITMEYVEGGSLSQRIYGARHQRFSFYEILEALLEICSGLACAHGLGIVHRDLKPDNVLLTVAGAIKLSDFGLARTVGTDRGLTQTGDTVGTPYYMAPEQLRGERPDHRVDIYALGILAYELVVGQRPFVHDNYLQLASKHINEPIPKFATRENGIPLWMQEFVERAAAKRKENRFQSADEAAAVIAKHLSESEHSQIQRAPAVLSLYTAETTKPRMSVAKVVGVSVGAAALAALMLGGITLYRNNSFATSTRVVEPVVQQPNEDDKIARLLFDWVQKGNESSLASTLEMFPTGVNALDADGVSLLHRAVEKGNTEVVKVLLKYRPELNKVDPKGYSALDIAIESGHTKIENILRGEKAVPKRFAERTSPEAPAAAAVVGTAQPSESPKKTLTLQKRPGARVTIVRARSGSPAYIRFAVQNISPVAAVGVVLKAYDGSKLIGSFPISSPVEPGTKPDLTVTHLDTNSAEFTKVLERESLVRFKITCSNCDREVDLS